MAKAGTLSVQMNPIASGQGALRAPWAWDSYADRNVFNCAAFFGDPNYDDVEIKRRRAVSRAPAQRETYLLDLSACLAIIAAGALGVMRFIERR